jgi:hypothetical protein
VRRDERGADAAPWTEYSEHVRAPFPVRDRTTHRSGRGLEQGRPVVRPHEEAVRPGVERLPECSNRLLGGDGEEGAAVDLAGGDEGGGSDDRVRALPLHDRGNRGRIPHAVHDVRPPRAIEEVHHVLRQVFGLHGEHDPRNVLHAVPPGEGNDDHSREEEMRKAFRRDGGSPAATGRLSAPPSSDNRQGGGFCRGISR